MTDFLVKIWESTGLHLLFKDDPWLLLKTLIMYVIVGALVYLAIVKGFEPLLLLPIAFGMLLANIPGANLFHSELFISTDPNFEFSITEVIKKGNLIDFLYLGVKLGIYPSLIFLGVGAMTDFSPLIADPKRLFMGGTAQLGVFAAFAGALLLGFTPKEAGAIGIIGGADGPTAILVTKILAPHLLGAIAIAAYSYMALIPMIQPPIMKLMTTKKERAIKMEQLRSVSKLELVAFPIIVTILVSIILPDAAPLIGFRMFGNLLGGLIIGGLVYSMLIGSNAVPIWVVVASLVLCALLLTNQISKLKALHGMKKKLVMLLAVICFLPIGITLFIHGYFDIFAGFLQTYIFCLLSMVYITP